jgi:hypothetical protein
MGAKEIICPYCKKPTELVNGNVIYPHRPDLAGKMFYLCRRCDAFVGCHNGTTNPLGSPANSALRTCRKAAHDAFDWIWKSGHMRRSEAYAWLTKTLSIRSEDCHIGMFDQRKCLATIQAVREKRKSLEVSRRNNIVPSLRRFVR